MSRSPVGRAAATLLALLLLLAVGEPLALHACPMHDGVVPTASPASASTTGDHAAHAAHAVAQTGQPADGHDGDHQCSCLGHCAAAAGAVLPGAQAVRWQVLVSRRAEPPAPEHRVARASADHLLPFANGPPHLA
jgi:hypothetical protein